MFKGVKQKSTTGFLQAISGMVTSPLVSVTDLLRIRETATYNGPSGYNTWAAITMIREIISLSIYFGTYSYTRPFLEKKGIGSTTSIITA